MLLLDANISWRIAKRLKEVYGRVIHVDETDYLEVPATDIDIWNYAKQQGLMIVTNDDDFLHLLLQKGFPPKLILMKRGNITNTEVTTLLLERSVEVHKLFDSIEHGILEIH